MTLENTIFLVLLLSCKNLIKPDGLSGFFREGRYYLRKEAILRRVISLHGDGTALSRYARRSDVWVLVKIKEDLLMLSVKAKFHILYHALSRYARRYDEIPGLDTGFSYAEAVLSAILSRFGNLRKEVPAP